MVKKAYNLVDFRSRRFACLRAVREPPRLSPLSLPPAGVCAPSTPINKVTSFNLRLKKKSEKQIKLLLCNFQLCIGAKGRDSSGGSNGSLIPLKCCEEAQAPSRGKRSHFRKGTAVLNQKLIFFFICSLLFSFNFLYRR